MDVVLSFLDVTSCAVLVFSVWMTSRRGERRDEKDGQKIRGAMHIFKIHKSWFYVVFLFFFC